MLYFRRSRFIRFVILPLTLIALLPACHKWVGVETNVVSPTELSGPIRVTLNDGEELNLEGATVTEDSIFGRRKGTPRSVLGEPQPIRIALDDVTDIEKEKVKPVESVLLAVVVVGTAVIASLALSFSRSCLFCE